MKTFTFHTDNAHAWLEVSTSDLAAVGMTPADFSPYSYADRRGATPVYYLEEDCDATKFIVAWEKRNANTPRQFADKHQAHSFVRSLPRIVGRVDRR